MLHDELGGHSQSGGQSRQIVEFSFEYVPDGHSIHELYLSSIKGVYDPAAHDRHEE